MNRRMRLWIGLSLCTTPSLVRMAAQLGVVSEGTYSHERLVQLVLGAL